MGLVPEDIYHDNQRDFNSFFQVVKIAKQKSGVKDTTAYIISRQIMDHIYGDDEEMSEEDFVNIYRDFHRRGGSWKSIMDGDMKSVKIIEDSLEHLVRSRGIGQIAAKIAAKPIYSVR